MPEQETVRRANAKKRAGKAPSTQAGEFVREEMHHIHAEGLETETAPRGFFQSLIPTGSGEEIVALQIPRLK